MNKSYAEFVRQDRRLLILRVLRGIPERRANQYILRATCASLGHEEIVETLANDMRWLEKQGLLLVEEMGGGILLGTLTDLGDQAARGVVRIAGVATPAVG